MVSASPQAQTQITRVTEHPAFIDTHLTPDHVICQHVLMLLSKSKQLAQVVDTLSTTVGNVGQRLFEMDEILAAVIEVLGADVVRMAVMKDRATKQRTEIDAAVESGDLDESIQPVGDQDVVQFTRTNGMVTYCNVAALPDGERKDVLGKSVGDVVSEGITVTAVWKAHPTP